MTFDNKGRIIASHEKGPLYRITLPAGGQPIKVEEIKLKIGSAQGLLYAFDSLYVVVNGGAPGSGLYRISDTDGDDAYDKLETLKKFDGAGEHGPHAVLLGPTSRAFTSSPATSRRSPRAWTRTPPPTATGTKDLLLPRLPDGGGHDPHVMAPGGWVARTTRTVRTGR
jgi:hypothetical protein